ncbi:magnesium chelatase [Brevibacillus choshinensis]|uniref:Magnesium chelatase n=2 Tax=Brevibacillus choshinensis TaxID=54911 RepID=A0ABR5N3U1_BRECH|nr:magnesium chelatase [Brevibacillus choshinensis]
MKMVKPVLSVILLICVLGLQACTSEEAVPVDNQQEQPTRTKPVEPEGTADGQEPASPNQAEKSREQKVAELQALIPDTLTRLPASTEDFYSMPPGRFSGRMYGEQSDEIKEVLHRLPNLESVDEEAVELYYRVLLSLFGEDYPDPQDIIDQMKLASFGDPSIGDPRFQFKKQYNVMILLDASGSMAASAGGKTRMQSAKEAITSFAASLPAGANVSLRVYGHEGSGSEADKAHSCASSEVMYPMQAYDKQKLQSSLAQFKPAGWTPIALALQQAEEDLRPLTGEQNTNIIYLVSDGIETCGGNPVEAAKQLADSDITPIVNVVGFGVDGEGQQQLKKVAEAAGGRYVFIQDQKELQKEFEQAKRIAQKWEKWLAGSTYEALSTTIAQSVTISEYGSKWQSIASRESYNFLSALTELGARKTLSEEMIAALEKLESKQEKLARQRADELEDFLDTLNEKTYQEAIAAIQQQFRGHVKGN